MAYTAIQESLWFAGQLSDDDVRHDHPRNDHLRLHQSENNNGGRSQGLDSLDEDEVDGSYMVLVEQPADKPTTSGPASDQLQYSRDQISRQLFDSIRRRADTGMSVEDAVDSLETMFGADSLHDVTDYGTGMTALHLALLVANNDTTVRFLLERGGEALVVRPAETAEFLNLTSLCLALLNCRPSVVNELLCTVCEEKRAEFVNMRVRIRDGVLPHEELTAASLFLWSYSSRELDDTAREHLSVLLQHGLDLSLEVSHGNTLLHVLVLQSVQQSMGAFQKHGMSLVYDDLVGPWYMRTYCDGRDTQATNIHRMLGMRELMSLTNSQGLTPMQLAAARHSYLLKYLMTLPILRFPDPKLGVGFRDVSTYDVTETDSLDMAGNYSETSVLHQVAHCEVDLSKWAQECDIVDSEPIRTVLSAKWRAYRVFFYGWGLIHVAFMILMTGVALLSNEQFNSSHTSSSMNNTTTENITTESVLYATTGNVTVEMSTVAMTTNVTKQPISDGSQAGRTSTSASEICLALFLLVIPCAYIGLEVRDICSICRFNISHLRWLKKMTSSGMWLVSGNCWYRIQVIVFSASVIVWVGLRLAGSDRQEVALSIALVLGWNFLVFFTRALEYPRGIGSFSIMLHQMLFNDMIPFLFITFIVLIGFSTAMHVLVVHPGVKVTPTFNVTFFRMLGYFTDNDNKGGYESATRQDFSRFLIIVYSLITVILLVNMLIAAMNRSYELVRTTKVNLLARQRLSILLLLERRSPACFRQFSRRQFEEAGNRVYVKVNRPRDAYSW